MTVPSLHSLSLSLIPQTHTLSSRTLFFLFFLSLLVVSLSLSLSPFNVRFGSQIQCLRVKPTRATGVVARQSIESSPRKLKNNPVSQKTPRLQLLLDLAPQFLELTSQWNFFGRWFQWQNPIEAEFLRSASCSALSVWVWKCHFLKIHLFRLKCPFSENRFVAGVFF
jgi:hypothetical protein